MESVAFAASVGSNRGVSALTAAVISKKMWPIQAPTQIGHSNE
jgi:hypothetical protein